MIRRCSGISTNEKESSYTKRGIVVSEELQDFKVFFDCVGEAPSSKHTLDRINNDKGYERGNLRWATPRENSCNRADTRYYDYRGKLMTIVEIEPFLECPVNTFVSRLRRGWTLEESMGKSKLPNRRMNDLINFDGQEKTLGQWARDLGVSRTTLYDRLNKLGWSIEKTLSTPSLR